jgi:hypothetical protein
MTTFITTKPIIDKLAMVKLFIIVKLPMVKLAIIKINMTKLTMVESYTTKLTMVKLTIIFEHD